MDDETRPIRTPDAQPDAQPYAAGPAPDPTSERRRRWLRPVAAGVGLVVIGGLGGFGIGHATAGGDQLTPTSFRGGPPGGPSRPSGQGEPGGQSGTTTSRSTE